MKTAKKINQRSVTELVQAGHVLQIYPTVDNSCQIIPIARGTGAPGKPIAVTVAQGFTSDIIANADQVFRIEATRDVYYAVSPKLMPGLILDESNPPVPLED